MRLPRLIFIALPLALAAAPEAALRAEDRPAPRVVILSEKLREILRSPPRSPAASQRVRSIPLARYARFQAALATPRGIARSAARAESQRVSWVGVSWTQARLPSAARVNGAVGERASLGAAYVPAATFDRLLFYPASIDRGRPDEFLPISPAPTHIFP